MESEAWTEIIHPLFIEMVAGVSGRFTNGRFHHGTFASSQDGRYLAGYQRGITDLYNYLRDFIDARDKMMERKRDENKQQPYYNPFMEEMNETA